MELVGYCRTKAWIKDSESGDIDIAVLDENEGTPIYKIGNEWKCGCCWKNDPDFAQKFEESDDV